MIFAKKKKKSWCGVMTPRRIRWFLSLQDVLLTTTAHISYVVMQKPQPQPPRLPPPRTLIMDYTMTHICFGRSHLHPMGQLTNTRRSDGAPDPDVTFKEVARIKIRHYRNLYLNHPDPVTFTPLAVDTTGRMYDEFIRLLFFSLSPWDIDFT